MTSVAEIEDQVRTFICTSFLTETQAETFHNDDDLLTLLDSLQLLRTVIHLESAAAIRIGNDELTPENLGTVARIAAFVARKRG